MFVDPDPKSGMSTPTTYVSMLRSMNETYPISSEVPEQIGEHLVRAIDFVALAYEQAKLERWQFFGPLTNTGLTSALLALELTLRLRLGLGPEDRSTFGLLITKARETGILARSKENDAVWDRFLADRNQLVHGDDDAPIYGMTTRLVVGHIVNTINAMFTV